MDSSEHKRKLPSGQLVHINPIKLMNSLQVFSIDCR